MRIVWYPALDSAPWLPFPSAFISRYWQGQRPDYSGLPPYPDTVGEVIGADRLVKWTPPKFDATGERWCGSPDDFRYGCHRQLIEPPVRYRDDGLPQCCGLVAVPHGGIGVGGSAPMDVVDGGVAVTCCPGHLWPTTLVVQFAATGTGTMAELAGVVTHATWNGSVWLTPYELSAGGYDKWRLLIQCTGGGFTGITQGDPDDPPWGNLALASNTPPECTTPASTLTWNASVLYGYSGSIQTTFVG